jgi:hypothetical protein
VRLTTALVFMEDDDALSGDAVIRKIYVVYCAAPNR